MLYTTYCVLSYLVRILNNFEYVIIYLHYFQVIKDDMWPNPLQYYLAPEIEVENGIRYKK